MNFLFFYGVSAPDPAGGAHDAPPDPLVGWGGGYPLSISHPFDACGISISRPNFISRKLATLFLPNPSALGSRRELVSNSMHTTRRRRDSTRQLSQVVVLL